MTSPHLILSSHGLKTSGNATGSHYIVPKAHVYIDCRGTPDGEDAEEVYDWLAHEPEEFLDPIRSAVDMMPTRRKGAPDPFAEPILVCFLCAWGQNRSPSMKQAMARVLRETYPNWIIEVK